LRILGTNTDRRNVAGFLPAVIWAIVVTILSLTSVSIVPKFVWSDLIGIDKLGHMVFYCILALLVFYGFIRHHQRFRHVVLWTVTLCSGFGVLMEVLQLCMRAGRQFEFLDILADVIGVLFAYCIFNASLKKKYYGSF